MAQHRDHLLGASFPTSLLVVAQGHLKMELTFRNWKTSLKNPDSLLLFKNKQKKNKRVREKNWQPQVYIPRLAGREERLALLSRRPTTAQCVPKAGGQAPLTLGALSIFLWLKIPLCTQKHQNKRKQKWTKGPHTSRMLGKRPLHIVFTPSPGRRARKHRQCQRCWGSTPGLATCELGDGGMCSPSPSLGFLVIKMPRLHGGWERIEGESGCRVVGTGPGSRAALGKPRPSQLLVLSKEATVWRGAGGRCSLWEQVAPRAPSGICSPRQLLRPEKHTWPHTCLSGFCSSLWMREPLPPAACLAGH